MSLNNWSSLENNNVTNDSIISASDNSDTDVTDFTEALSIAAGVVYLLSVLCGYVGTVLVIPGMLSRTLRALPAYQLMFSLMLTNTVGLVAFTNVAINALLAFNIDDTVRMCFGFLADFSWFAGVWHFYCIAVNRFVSIVLPQYKDTVASRKVTKKMIIACWLAGLTCTLSHLMPNGTRLMYIVEECTLLYNSDAYSAWDQYCNYVAVVVLPPFYVAIIWKLRKTRIAVELHNANAYHQHSISSPQERKVIFQFFVQYLVFAISNIITPILAYLPGSFWLGCANTITWMFVTICDPWVAFVVNQRLRHSSLERLQCMRNHVEDISQITLAKTIRNKLF